MSENNTPPEKTVEELKLEVARLESEKAGLVGETQDLRKARQEKEEQITTLQDALKAATDKNNASPEDEKIAAAIAKVLSQKEEDRAKANRKAAFDKFVAENKEYHPDNDPSGLKRTALEKELAQFNTNGIVETDDFVKVIGKANALLRGTDTPRQANTDNPYSSTPSNPAPPAPGPDKDLSEQEKKLIDRNGWTKEKYMSLKAKMPDFIEGLIAGVR